jgi:3'-phosphoadenosine 5'-phosphosulfate sulfotransferase (PAPS reductase)/FAD synthetase
MSISGGRSSVMLAKLLVDTKRLYSVEEWHCTDFTEEDFFPYTVYIDPANRDEYIFVFANTSREKKATLVFMNEVEKIWGLKVIWIEAVIDFRRNKGTRHRIVNYATAKTDGSIYEDVIKKYGIPDTNFPHCTREMKQYAIRSFFRKIGWGTWKDYKTILGYRADEPKRANLVKAEKLNQWYPLHEWGIKKADVAYFWNRQNFDLAIDVDADGNCDRCFKKSDLKLIYQEKVSADVWVRRMEREHEFNSGGREGTGKPYRFFRHNRTLDEVIGDYPELKNKSIDEIKGMLNDKSLNEEGANFDLVEQEDCAESCEAFTEQETE